MTFFALLIKWNLPFFSTAVVRLCELRAHSSVSCRNCLMSTVIGEFCTWVKENAFCNWNFMFFFRVSRWNFFSWIRVIGDHHYEGISISHHLVDVRGKLGSWFRNFGKLTVFWFEIHTELFACVFSWKLLPRWLVVKLRQPFPNRQPTAMQVEALLLIFWITY